MPSPTLKIVVALRRYNPGKSRGNRPVLEPIFQGENINPRWNLIAPPQGDFRIASLSDGDTAGYSPIAPGRNQYTGHPLVAKDRVVYARGLVSTEGLKSALVKLGLVKI
jgi:hypothetical protein